MNDYPFDADASRAGRDKGMDDAASEEDRRGKWRLNAMLIIIRSFPTGWEGLAEEFQPVVIDVYGPPHIGNVWGTITNSLLRARWFEFTGELGQCRLPTNHARTGRILRKLGR